MEVVQTTYNGPKGLSRGTLARKRSQRLKRKPQLPKKRTRVSVRKPKTPEAKLKAKLWELCKQIIRKRYGNSCYTCEAKGLHGSNWHTGHFIPSSLCGGYLRWDLRNLRPQCYRCNISLAGNGSAYYRNLVKLDGQTYVDELFKDKERVTKLNRTFLQAKIDEYTKILDELPRNDSISA